MDVYEPLTLVIDEEPIEYYCTWKNATQKLICYSYFGWIKNYADEEKNN